MTHKQSAINPVFLGFIIVPILFAAWFGNMKAVSDASFEAAKSAVTLAINLVGVMGLWLGFVRILEAGGLMYRLAEIFKPLFTRLFPEVPAKHPAMGAIMLNFSANFLGLGNAATPFGIKAMMELNKLNPVPGTATHAMCMFLAINTASITLLPLSVIAVRAAAGSFNPAGIFLPTLLSTIGSTLVGILAAWWFMRKEGFVRAHEVAAVASSSVHTENYDHLLTTKSRYARFGIPLVLLSVLGAAVWQGLQAPNAGVFLLNEIMSYWLMPFLMLIIVLYGWQRGVKVYEAVTEGAKQGFDVALRIIPYLVAILVAIALLRSSGLMDVLATGLAPVLSKVHMPAEVLPLALIRPLSGGGAFGVMSALVEADPNSYTAFVASVMQGSTDTTFYILAVYFGAIGVVHIRYALIAGLLADVAGILSSVFWSYWFWKLQ